MKSIYHQSVIPEFAKWNGTNVFTIRIQGCGEFVRSAINRLVEDFNAPKFGYSGEEYDEEK